MPTGYTYLIQEGIDLKDFIMKCARNFGALIEMRDTPMDVEIPEKFEPSDYHRKRIGEVEKRLEYLKKMNAEKAERKAYKEYVDKLDRKEKSIQEIREIKGKYMNMMVKVRQWIPPTEEHKNLKDFMVDQIEKSIKFDCNENCLTKDIIIRLSGEEWRDKEIQKGQDDLVYYKKGWKEENDRVDERNKWLKELRDSL